MEQIPVSKSLHNTKNSLKSGRMSANYPLSFLFGTVAGVGGFTAAEIMRRAFSEPGEIPWPPYLSYNGIVMEAFILIAALIAANATIKRNGFRLMPYFLGAAIGVSAYIYNDQKKVLQFPTRDQIVTQIKMTPIALDILKRKVQDFIEAHRQKPADRPLPHKGGRLDKLEGFKKQPIVR